MVLLKKNKINLAEIKTLYPEFSWIEIVGTCRDCENPVLCVPNLPNHVDKSSLSEEDSLYDYWYFCSNPKCSHHRGFGMDDMYSNYYQIDDFWIIPSDTRIKL